MSPSPEDSRLSQRAQENGQPSEGFFQELLRSVGLPGLFERRPKNPDTLQTLPESVRYQLEHEKAQISKEGVLALARSPGYEDTAIYLAAKFLEPHPVKEAWILRQVFECLRGKPACSELPLEDYTGVPEILERGLSRNSNSQTVPGSKVAMIQRFGPYYWRSQLRELVRGPLESPSEVPMIVASSMLYALPSIARLAPVGKSFLVISEKRISAGVSPFGLICTPTKESCTLEPIRRCTDLRRIVGGREVIFIDDVLKTGSTFRKVRDLFASLPNFPILDGEKTRFGTMISDRGVFLNP